MPMLELKTDPGTARFGQYIRSPLLKTDPKTARFRQYIWSPMLKTDPGTARRGLDNTSEAPCACSKQTPKRRGLDQATGAPCSKQTPKRSGVGPQILEAT